MAGAMNRRARTRLVIVTITIAGIIWALATVGVVGGSRVASVGQVLDGPSGEGVQVTGRVSWVDPDLGNASFRMEQGGESVLVVSEVPLPSALGVGTDVIVTGTSDGEGNVLASGIVTKCPSKYES